MDALPRPSLVIGSIGRDDRVMWYVYFLRLANGDVYVGSSNNLKVRIAAHRCGRVISTKRYLPFELISYVAVRGEGNARALERYFKSGSGKAFAKKRFWDAVLPECG